MAIPSILRRLIASSNYPSRMKPKEISCGTTALPITPCRKDELIQTVTWIEGDNNRPSARKSAIVYCRDLAYAAHRSAAANCRVGPGADFSTGPTLRAGALCLAAEDFSSGD